MATIISNTWLPGTIFIERYNESKQNLELLSYDYWILTSVNVTPPVPASFDVVYEADTLVENYLPIAEEPLTVRHVNSLRSLYPVRRARKLLYNGMLSWLCKRVLRMRKSTKQFYYSWLS